MDNTIQSTAPKKERITSIDALRAFTLLGILIVHANEGFGFHYDSIHNDLDYLLYKFVFFLLASKCNTIFAILFGVSFYLILRNPKNTNAKFVWRCFLLMLIGLFNKLFYSYDALMRYGFCGMFLILFRDIKPKWLFVISICLLMAHIFILPKFQLGTLLLGPVTVQRYGINKSFCDVLSNPYTVADYLRIVLDDNTLRVFAMFIMGYGIAKIGMIEHIEERLTKRILVISWVVFIFFFMINFLLYNYWAQNHLMNELTNYSASFAYALALLYVYYHSGVGNRLLRFFEPYGKLGLTNYSMGGILGVVFINQFGLGLYKYPLTIVVMFFIGFFLLQAVFSYYWLRYFTYGPMEYVWRVATERKQIPFRRHLSD